MQIKAASLMREEGWQCFWGKPTSTTRSAAKAARGGVAIAVRKEMPAKQAAAAFETAVLRDDARWDEVVVAVGNGNKHIHHAAIYGYDGAASEAERYRLNEDLLARSMLRMLESLWKLLMNHAAYKELRVSGSLRAANCKAILILTRSSSPGASSKEHLY